MSRFVFVFILLFLALAAAHGQQQERIAILQTVDDGDSIKPSDLNYLTDRIRETAVNILPKSRYGVMTMESIVAFLGSQERMVKECKAASCLAEIGRKVNADYVAQARVGRFEGDLTIKAELYSSKSGNLLGSFTGDSKSMQGLRNIIDEKAPVLLRKLPGASGDSRAVSPSVEGGIRGFDKSAAGYELNEEKRYLANLSTDPLKRF
jgi:TolB-like protein